MTQRRDHAMILASSYDTGPSLALGMNRCGNAVGWARSGREVQSAVLWRNAPYDGSGR